MSVSSAAGELRGRPPVGELLRAWRRRRSISQLDLALDADVSTRHVSFVETGRARPSREMVLRLAERLEVPLRDRNSLLLAAGYAPVFVERSLDAPDMDPVRRALDRFLRAHEPYPAVVLDRHYTLLLANDAITSITDGVAPALLEPPANALRITLHPDGMRPASSTSPSGARTCSTGCGAQAQVTGDPVLAALHDELAGYPGVSLDVSHDEVSAADVVLPLRLHGPDGELAFFATI